MIPNLRYDPEDPYNDPYPDSDGLPMAENTEQYQWIVKIKENLEILFAANPNVFIAGDLLWYPVPDRLVAGPMAPDVLVAFGRPKGKRGSYKQWEEDGVAPQVVFEILSPSNHKEEMRLKLAFYQKYGVEEYYIYNPDNNRFEVYMRNLERLEKIAYVKGWCSPRLQIKFEPSKETLQIYYPDGRPFLTSIELAEQAEQARIQAEQATAQAEQAKAELAIAQAENQRMKELLRSLGINPE
jgi:Uma2 family endonuclease